jgi:homopolymeric O-antigen transport system ATP-binding protein
MSFVRLSGVHFSYPVYQLTGRSLKITLLRQVAGGRISENNGTIEVNAVSNVSFELHPGDSLGLIGHNGSGKSTLLRLIAGLTHPTQGTVETNGRLVPLIEKAMGINPELSGMANIELPLRLLGATDAEIKRAKNEIPEWTGLGRFMQLPIRTYSDGMKARLSFALCTSIPADILVLDEWLGAGDLRFVEQAQQRLSGYINQTQIVVLASHSNELIRRVCNLAAWMERGQLIMIGPAGPVLDAYTEAMRSDRLAVAAE